jgi:hypothetical protein
MSRISTLAWETGAWLENSARNGVLLWHKAHRQMATIHPISSPWIPSHTSRPMMCSLLECVSHAKHTDISQKLFPGKCTHAQTYTHAHTHMLTHTHTHARTHARTHVHTHTHNHWTRMCSLLKQQTKKTILFWLGNFWFISGTQWLILLSESWQRGLAFEKWIQCVQLSTHFLAICCHLNQP